MERDEGDGEKRDGIVDALGMHSGLENRCYTHVGSSKRPTTPELAERADGHDKTGSLVGRRRDQPRRTFGQVGWEGSMQYWHEKRLETERPRRRHFPFAPPNKNHDGNLQV